MHFTNLIGKELKSNEVVEIIEHFEIDVIYDFDRLNENIDDIYWASFEKQGFQFRFDEDQILDVIFIYLKEKHGFTNIKPSEIDVPLLNSYDSAKKYFQDEGINYQNSEDENPSDSFYKKWIKGFLTEYSIHYEYEENQLGLITLSKIN